jgi:hypothetical protein
MFANYHRSVPFELALKDVEGLAICMRMNRRDNAWRNIPVQHAISVVVIRQRREVPDGRSENVENLGVPCPSMLNDHGMFSLPIEK